VFNGTYIGYVVINKSIDLIGEDKNSTFIIGYFAFAVSIVTDWVNVSGFYIQNNARLGEGVRIDSSNSSFCNNIVNIPEDKVRINGYNNKFSGNTMIGESIYLIGDRNTISGNTISNTEHGVFLTYACDNIISNNSFFYGGLFLSENDVYKNIVVDNTVNNKPLVYLYDEHDLTITGDPGQIILVNCTNIIVENHEISNTNVALQIWGSSSCIISGNIFTENHFGVYINSWNNRINDNIIANNYFGIWFLSSSYENLIYHNNLVNNSANANDEGMNTWNLSYPYCGNYWDDYPYKDEKHGPNQDLPEPDRIGDFPYDLPYEHALDLYPVMHPFGWLNEAPEIITIDGSTTGKAGQRYYYTSSAEDPEEDPIYYMFDWGDGNFSDWIGPYPSGGTGTESHTWEEPGDYEIRVKAKDTRGLESGWSDPFPITMPRNRLLYYPLLKYILERFSNELLILRYILSSIVINI